MPLDAGALNRRVKLLRHEKGKDKYGDPVEGFASVGPLWANVRPAPGTERLANAENAASALTVVTIRWSKALDPNADTGVNPKWRLEYPPGSGRTFDIKSAIEIGNRDGIQIAAQGRAEQ